MKLLAGALCIFIAGCDGNSKEQDAWFLLQVRAEAAVKSNLRDPSSAEFSGVRVNVENEAVCGSVNAKNGFGGFSGPTAYAYAAGEALLNDGSQAYQMKSLKCVGGTSSPPGS